VPVHGYMFDESSPQRPDHRLLKVPKIEKSPWVMVAPAMVDHRATPPATTAIAQARVNVPRFSPKNLGSIHTPSPTRLC
jgi:hypothetical protein